MSDPASPWRWSASPWRRPAVSLAVDAMISTRDLSLLPDVNGLRALLQTMATLEEYFEVEVDLASVQHVYQHRPLTPAVVAALNPELSPADLISDLDEIGYPVAKDFR